MVLIIEALTPDFGHAFWEFIHKAGYEHIQKSSGKPQFYRFSKPVSSEYPFMIELFSRKIDTIPIPETAVLTPVPLEDDISSLSAILLDDEYYQFLIEGRTSASGFSVLDAYHLIPFKMKAWLDLSRQKESGKAVDSKNIRKHKNDVFRLFNLIDPDLTVEVSRGIELDIKNFLNRMETEDTSFKNLGMTGVSKLQVLDVLNRIYVLKQG